MNELLQIAEKTLLDHQGENIIEIDMRSVNPFTDYFLVCSVSNSKHARAIADYLEDNAQKEGYDTRSIEGDRNSDWVLVDMKDVIVHIFTPAGREKYQLERLWKNQPQKTIED